MENVKKRIDILDSFRGIAAIIVVLFHFTSHYQTKFNSLSIHKFFEIDWGDYGVQLFFVLSGFVIYMTISKDVSVKTFMLKRFVRLYPTYWICLVITSLFLYFFPVKLFHFSVSEFIVHLTMIQSAFKIENIDGSYWSLFPELIFYFMMAGLIFIKKQNQVMWIVLVWLLLIVVNLFRHSFLEIYLNLRFGIFFIAGIMFYRIYKGFNTYKEHLIIAMCLVLSYFIYGTISAIVAYSIILAGFYLAIFQKLNFLNIPLFQFLGKISYPLYLIHQSIGMTLIYYFQIKGINDYFSILIVLGISLLLGTFITYYLEKPVLRFMHKKLF